MIYQLSQTFCSTTREFELNEDGRLTVRFANKRFKNTRTFDLCDIAEDSLEAFSQGRFIDRQVIAGLILVILFALPALLIVWQTGFSATTIVFLCFAILFGYYTFRAFRRLREEAYDVHIYQYREGGAEAFTLFNNLPDKNTFASFISAMRAKIITLRPRLNYDKLQDEGGALLRDLERLHAAGVLIGADYHTVKERILSRNPQRPQIGFNAN